MQLKKILVSLLVAIMILSTAVIGASAAEAVTTSAKSTFDIAVETKTTADAEGNVAAKAGDTVEVSVVIKNNPGVALLQFVLKYDDKTLTPVKGSDGKVAIESGIYSFKDSVLASANGIDTSVSGSIRVTADLNNKIDIKETGTVLKLSFKIGDKFDGTTKVEVVDEYAFTANYAQVAVVKAPLNMVVHSFGAAQVTAPTCTTEGYSITTCANCKLEVKSDVVAATGHTEVAVPGYAATCTTKGLSDGSKCSVCATVLVEQTEIPTNDDHKPVEIPAVAATCTSKGATAGSKCSACDKVLVDPTEVAELAHTTEIIPAVEPTYSEAGSTEGEKCSVCGEILKAPETVEKLSLAWLYIVIGAVAVVGVAVVVVVVVLKKKK